MDWGSSNLSPVLGEFSRYRLAWKLTPTIGATDEQNTLNCALADYHQHQRQPRAELK